MLSYGITISLVSELQFNFKVYDDNSMFVVLPHMNKNSVLGKELGKRYLARSISFLIPPKPYLGSKSVLALLRNEEQDQTIESVLRANIPTKDLEYVRAFIPPTFLVGASRRKRLQLDGWKEALAANGYRYVLKQSIASGMKGVHFSDDPTFQRAMQEAESSQGFYVLQREVHQLDREFSYYAKPDILEKAIWHTRVTAHIIGETLADIVVTARQDKRVHGAPDCIQIGTTLI
jgi:hypothetical protein